MSNPIYLHILSNGDIWASIDKSFVPTGTVLSTHAVNSSTSTQKLGTITATAGAVTAVSGANGKNGKELV